MNNLVFGGKAGFMTIQGRAEYEKTILTNHIESCCCLAKLLQNQYKNQLENRRKSAKYTVQLLQNGQFKVDLHFPSRRRMCMRTCAVSP